MLLSKIFFQRSYQLFHILDSSNMTMEDWIHISQDIQDAYELFDGFVVLHGTDTLAYTASALSFMLENLGTYYVFFWGYVNLVNTVKFFCLLKIRNHICEV